ncbi:MAG: hypothetical protein ABGZ35_14370, partial [Planctomycetaceae bacterium]
MRLLLFHGGKGGGTVPTQVSTGLMHVPENGGIGFAGRRENCCAPPYQTIEFSLKAKERNSGA